MRLVRLVFVSLYILASNISYASEAETEVEVKADVETNNEGLEIIGDTLSTGAELSQQSLKLIGSGIDFFVNPIDNFFSGDSEENTQSGKTQVRISYGLIDTKLDTFQTDLSFSVKVALPKTKNRLSLFVEDINESLNGSDSSSNSNASNTSDNAFQIGLFSIFNFNDYLDFRWKVGSQWSSGSVDFFVTLGSNINYSISEQWTGQLRNEFFSYQSIGDGFLMHLTFDDKISENWTFRAKTSLDYYKADTQLFYSQSINWYQKYNEKRRFAYNIGKQWSQFKGDDIIADKYNASVLVRDRIYKKWVYLTIETGLQYELSNDFEEDPFFLVSIEIYSNDVE